MVRLKVLLVTSTSTLEKYFNSTMVRLKADLKYLMQVYDKFQFHYGSIKRQIKSLFYKNKFISIPLWFD